MCVFVINIHIFLCLSSWRAWSRRGTSAWPGPSAPSSLSSTRRWGPASCPSSTWPPWTRSTGDATSSASSPRSWPSRWPCLVRRRGLYYRTYAKLNINIFFVGFFNCKNCTSSRFLFQFRTNNNKMLCKNALKRQVTFLNFVCRKCAFGKQIWI